ncbi:MAG: LptF/LptG family permease [Myxococcota bacterium]
MVLDRYLLRMAAPRVAAVLALGVLVATGADVAEQGARVTADAGGWALAASFYALRVPLVAVEILPLACLVGAAWTLAALRARGELDALRTAGAGLARLARPFALLGAIAAAGVSVTSEIVVPRAERRASSIARSIVGLPAPERADAAIAGDVVTFGDGTAFRLRRGMIPERLAERRTPPRLPLLRPEAAPRAELAAAITALGRAGHETAYERTILVARPALAGACLLAPLVGLLVGFRLARFALPAALAASVAWAALCVFFAALGGAGAIPPVAAAWAPHALVLLISLGAQAMGRPCRRKTMKSVT